MRTLSAIALAVLALCGTASAQSYPTPTTTYGQDGQAVITQWSDGGYTVYAPDGMTVTEQEPAPITPPQQDDCWLYNCGQ